MLKARQIELAVRKSGNVTITVDKTSPRPTLERLDFGWAQVPPGYCVFLLSCASDNFKKPVLETRADLNAKSTMVGWDCGVLAIVSENIYYRTEPAKIPHGLIPVSISPL
jgi:hypothetical protein